MKKSKKYRKAEKGWTERRENARPSSLMSVEGYESEEKVWVTQFK